MTRRDEQLRQRTEIRRRIARLRRRIDGRLRTNVGPVVETVTRGPKASWVALVVVAAGVAGWLFSRTRGTGGLIDRVVGIVWHWIAGPPSDAMAKDRHNGEAS